ncbi:unnamed protein product [Hyaloperonospora brassicae]|uniref:RxLR effector candidate protein n=1 Tax=Hyaloperonospora brassicae TaxID=162125 RepID=A0AAV0UE67_HYABA|nr:unnamed protein product [Hyaloperonospora brassicae]
MRDSEDRMKNELAEVVDFAILELTDAAKNAEHFGLEEELTETVTRPFLTIIDDRTVQRANEFRDFARGGKPMDAQALADLLQRNKFQPSKLTPDQDDELINALLDFRKPTDVVKVLLSLRLILGMGPHADELHRKLVVYYKNDLGVMSDAWMRSGVDPKKLVRVLGWRLNPSMGDEMLPFVSTLFEYVGKFGEVHPKAVDNEDMFSIMFPHHSSAEIDASIQRMSETPGCEAIAKKLQELHSDIKIISPAKHVDTVPILSHAKIIRSMDFRLQEYVKFAKCGKAMDATVFENMLRPAADVAKLLLSYPMISYPDYMDIRMHRQLLRIKSTPGLMSHVWMEFGVHPEVLFKQLLVSWQKPEDRLYYQCLAEWFKYKTMFGEKHPDAFTTHDAAIVLFRNKPAELVEDGIRMVEEQHQDKSLAQLLRQMYQGFVREELAKASSALHTKAIRDSPTKPIVRL